MWIHADELTVSVNFLGIQGSAMEAVEIVVAFLLWIVDLQSSEVWCYIQRDFKDATSLYLVLKLPNK